MRKLEKKSFPDRGKSESQGTCVCVRVCSQILKTEYLHIVFMLVLSEPKTQQCITVGNRSFQRAQGMIRWKSKAMFCPECLNHLFSILRKNSKPNYLKCTGNKATGCVVIFFFGGVGKISQNCRTLFLEETSADIFYLKHLVHDYLVVAQ